MILSDGNYLQGPTLCSILNGGYEMCPLVPPKEKMLKDLSQKSCTNAPYNARRRAMYASTKLNKNYCTTSKQYLYNRCKTFSQKSFHYLSGVTDQEAHDAMIAANPNGSTKPGAPLAQYNKYVGNCTPSCVANAIGSVNERIPQCPTAGSSDPAVLNRYNCGASIYKPNNYAYAKQGSVSSGERLLRLNVNTINKNMDDIRRTKQANLAFLEKNKQPVCTPRTYAKNGDKTNCASL